MAIIGKLVAMATEEARNLGLLRHVPAALARLDAKPRSMDRKTAWLRQLEDIILTSRHITPTVERWRLRTPHNTPPYFFTPSPASAHNSNTIVYNLSLNYGVIREKA